ncbi:MAG: slipin family protein [Cyanobacteria bacterium P01_H01_bin.121]
MAYASGWRHEIIIKDTHRGLLYKNGVLVRVLEAGRHVIPWRFNLLGIWQQPYQEIVIVDVRERDLTIKGQEILTTDKVAIRVSIIVQFRVTDPHAAIHQVEDYESRLYSDVQLAARRSLATMSLEEILTNRNRLSEDILQDVQEVASQYGVAIRRADVKDLVFPGNLQEIMNRVLAAERMSEAQLVEARTKAEVQQIQAQAQAEIERLEQQTQLEAKQQLAQQAATAQHLQTEAEIQSLQAWDSAAAAYSRHPALLKLQEFKTLQELAQMSNARIYINLNSYPESNGKVDTESESD